MWAKTSLAYTLKNDKTKKYCGQLFNYLKMRDQKIAMTMSEGNNGNISDEH